MELAAKAIKLAKRAKKAMKAAKQKFERAEAAELKNKDMLVRNDNVDAREEEVTQREQRIAEREYLYQVAADKLKLAASNLATAAETEAVKTYPEKEKKLKLEQRSLKAQEDSMHKREQALKHKAELLAVRMQAFDDAVKHIIENSAKSSGGIADDWHRSAEKKVDYEVDNFEAALRGIRSKFSSNNTQEAAAARDGAKIMSAVHGAVKQSTQELQRVHLVERSKLKKHIVEKNANWLAARNTAQRIQATTQNSKAKTQKRAQSATNVVKQRPKVADKTTS